MTQFERNDRSFVKKLIYEEVDEARVGKVKRVYEHGASGDDSNFEADVLIDARTDEITRAQVASPASGAISAPKAGDTVLVQFTENNKSILTEILWSNRDRPPVGLAGMYRNRFDSGESGGGEGDLYITGYTEYDETVAEKEKPNIEREDADQAKAQRAVVQIAKHTEDGNVVPTEEKNIPGKIEFYDSPADNDSHISVEMNKAGGEDTEATWGIKFDLNNGSWQLVDENGFGMTCDGSGNFEWYGKTLDFEEPSGDTGPLSL